MGRARVGLIALCTAAIAFATAACTIVSGVDGMELRTSGATTVPAAAPSEAGAYDPFAPDAARPEASTSSSSSAGGGSSSSGGGGGTGPATCGSQGSWTDCDMTVSLATCATRCAQQGLTCVESCCAYDNAGDFAAKAGMVYAVLPVVDCAVKSVSASSKGGLCADPTILTAGGAAQVRCCCK